MGEKHLTNTCNIWCPSRNSTWTYIISHIHKRSSRIHPTQHSPFICRRQHHIQTNKKQRDAIKLQQDLDAAGKWEQDWLMHFQPDKCTIVSVTQKRKTILHTYQLHGHTLEKADSAKYLGITIQNNLKWDKHINTMTAKANQSLGFIKRNLKVH